ncbi:hypothetical protein GQ42DRAFT_160185 [Ramicandelaber brevisporus]|nr:hypothetical protein GQ42DRAFT_160185 [Ramicandelaber brevisporus]
MTRATRSRSNQTLLVYEPTVEEQTLYTTILTDVHQLAAAFDKQDGELATLIDSEQHFISNIASTNECESMVERGHVLDSQYTQHLSVLDEQAMQLKKVNEAILQLIQMRQATEASVNAANEVAAAAAAATAAATMASTIASANSRIPALATLEEPARTPSGRRRVAAERGSSRAPSVLSDDGSVTSGRAGSPILSRQGTAVSASTSSTGRNASSASTGRRTPGPQSTLSQPFIKVGQQAAARPTKVQENDEAEWLLSTVISVDAENGTVIVRDVAPNDQGAHDEFTLKATDIKPIVSLEDLQKTASGAKSRSSQYVIPKNKEIPVGSVVIALYPDTTCFYTGKVAKTPSQNTELNHCYQVVFEDDNDFVHHIEIPFVLVK